MSKLILYEYWRSSAAYRVRIALRLKGLAYDSIPVDLKPGAAEHKSDAYRAVNAQMRVPALVTETGASGQSMAILEWLEETWPEPAILPSDRWARLKCRAFADVIACDIHPLNNLSVLGLLKSDFSADSAAVSQWYAGWIESGFAALEAMAAELPPATFLFGDAPTLAEITLIPQIYNAVRFEVDLGAYPRLLELNETCLALEAFDRARPENQADTG